MSVMLLPGKGQQKLLKRELLRQRPVPAHLQTVCILNFIYNWSSCTVATSNTIFQRASAASELTNRLDSLKKKSLAISNAPDVRTSQAYIRPTTLMRMNDS